MLYLIYIYMIYDDYDYIYEGKPESEVDRPQATIAVPLGFFALAAPGHHLEPPAVHLRMSLEVDDLRPAHASKAPVA